MGLSMESTQTQRHVAGQLLIVMVRLSWCRELSWSVRHRCHRRPPGLITAFVFEVAASGVCDTPAVFEVAAAPVYDNSVIFEVLLLLNGILLVLLRLLML